MEADDTKTKIPSFSTFFQPKKPLDDTKNFFEQNVKFSYSIRIFERYETLVAVFDIETLGLDAFHHAIVLIGLKSEGKIKQWKLWKEKAELSMIFKCLEALKKIPSNETIVGYNNMKFDVPFITTRLQIHGKWTPDLWELLYRNRKWLDLYQFLGNDYRRMDLWCEKLGIKRKHGDILGRDIPIHYNKKQYSLIEQHNKDDLESSEQLYLKLQSQFPDLLRI